VSVACASCREPLTGRYCAACGEKRLDPGELTVRHFVAHTVVDEVVHLDGKVWRTLRSLMFRPGFLSIEYSEGRHRRYINPVRLLLIAIIVYALLTAGGFVAALFIYYVTLSIAPTSVPEGLSVADTVAQIDRFGILENILAAKSASVDLTSQAAANRFHRLLNQFAQPLSFTNVVLLALALYLVFRRRRTLLLDHAVFSMHLVSFVLLSSLAGLPAFWLSETNEWASPLIILMVCLWQFAYIATAIRRFYFAGRPSIGPRIVSIASAILIYILNSAFITGVQLLGGAIALRRL
jgi:hypothetical protein